MTSLECAKASPISSGLDANTLVSTVNETKSRSSYFIIDDAYVRMMGLEDKKRKFSEDMVDMDQKDGEKLQKFYRHIDRQANCRQKSQGTLGAFPLNSDPWKRKRRRTRSVCSGLIKEREADRRKKDMARPQSVFPPCNITLDKETEFVNNDMPSYSGTMLSKMLEEAEERRKLRRGERNLKRAKMMLTFGAMTLLVIVVTLAIASYPTIERIFGG